MPKPALTMVTRTQGNNRALKEGDQAAGFRPEFRGGTAASRLPPHGTRRGLRHLGNGADDLPLRARAHGSDLVGLPIFLVREFHHKSMAKHVGSGIETPKDLEGRRVGVSRGYTVTTGVWARTILADHYGVDLDFGDLGTVG